MDAHLVGPDDALWKDALAHADPDFYHLPGYTVVCAVHERGEPRALVVDDGARLVLVPLILRRSGPEHALDVTSPQGYPGMLVVGGADRGWVGTALHHGMDRLRDAGIVSAYIRLHPLLDRDPPQGIDTIVRHPDTIAIDLSLTDDELWSQTRPRFRSQISGAERAGHRVRLVNDDAALATFKSLYRSTMARRAAAPTFQYGDAYFSGLRAAVGDHFWIALVDVEGETAAAGLFIESAGILHLHLAGSDPRFDRAHPTKLMYHRVRAWAKQRGDRWMHLGGGRGTDDDSLLHFKSGFSPLRMPYRTLRVVVDEERYRALVARRFPDGVPDAAERYFPTYRAP